MSGCMKCTEKQLIHSFRDLTGGEHIEMRGNIRCCGNRSLYSHHAIVDKVNGIENSKWWFGFDCLNVTPY